MSNDPVTFKLCDERSQNILKAINDLGSKVDRVVDKHEGKIEEQGVELIRLQQQMDNGVLGRDFSNKRAVLVVSGIMVLITLLSNIDKIANIWR